MFLPIGQHNRGTWELHMNQANKLEVARCNIFTRKHMQMSFGVDRPLSNPIHIPY